MKNRHLLSIISILALACLTFSCEDDLSKIGTGLSNGEVAISIDSTGFLVNGKSVATPIIDARSTTNMLGQVSVPEYGDLKCSFVTRLMSATFMNVNDTVIADSVAGMKMVMMIPKTSVTGDSLSPQQLKVYKLTKSLPDSITNQFDPTGYYDPNNAFGVQNFTFSNMGIGDSTFYKSKTIQLSIPIEKEFAIDVFNKYRNDSTIFAWPASFEKYFHGIYVESSFGRGCVANISDISFYFYYKVGATKYVKEDSVTVTKRVSVIDSIPLFSTSPIVLSSNRVSLNVAQNIKDKVAAGEAVIQSPAGYNVEIDFPTQEIIDRYNSEKSNMAVVNNLSFFLPVAEISNDYGISVSPYLLMIKRSEAEDFFRQNKVPDNKSSFLGTYSFAQKGYEFTSMRDFILPLIKANEPVSDNDKEFVLIPISVTSQTNKNPYTGVETTYITSCTPYIEKPSMGIVDLDNVKIKLTYSKQEIY